MAWGRNNYGQTNVPPGLSNVIWIGAADYQSAVLKGDGSVAAWGLDASLPYGLSNITAVAIGGHSLAARRDGTLIAWGFNDGTLTPPSNLSNVVAVAVGPWHSLALKADGKVVAWGSNTHGQTNVPPGLSNVVAIAAGQWHSLALRRNGTVIGWGDNFYGQSGTPFSSDIRAIGAGYLNSFALRSNGTVVAWGSSGYGLTKPPAGLRNVCMISAHAYRCMALTVKPSVSTIELIGQDAVVRFPTFAETRYAVEAFPDFDNGFWMRLSDEIITGTGADMFVTDTNATSRAEWRFYRIVQEP